MSDRSGPGATSRIHRRLAALDPSSAPIDGRSLVDWLIFIRSFAAELRYFDEKNRPVGTWNRFFPQDLDPASIAAYLEEGSEGEVAREAQAWLARPHVVLLLVFLDLVREVQREMNGFTARHLDFFYRDVLRLKPKGPVADRVHVLVEVAPDAELASLPAGSELTAGADASGVERVYRTTEDAVLSHARVAEVRTVAIDRTVPRAEAEEVSAVDWRFLYPRLDVMATSHGDARWPLFGHLPESSEEHEPEPAIGWALTSPILALTEGERSFIVVLAFEPSTFDPSVQEPLWQDASNIAVDISTAHGWVEPDFVVPQIVTSNSTLLLRLVLAKEAPPIAAPATDLWPLLRVRLRPRWDGEAGTYRIPYAELRPLRLLSVHVEAGARDQRDLALENESGVVDSAKPFEPFGPAPEVGSRLAIGHRDWIEKPLESVRFSFEWVGAPEDVHAHYGPYFDSEEAPTFRADFRVIDGHNEYELWTGAALLPKSNAQAPSLSEPLPPRAGAAAADAVTTWPRYIRWQLLPPDFGHSVFADLSMRRSQQLAAALALNPATDPAPFHVPPPYTPRIRDLRAEFTTSATYIGERSGQHRLWHVHPFGLEAIEAPNDESGIPLVAPFDHDGELHIGLVGLIGPLRLSLLFQLAVGSATPRAIPKAGGVSSPLADPVSIRWSLSHGEGWLDLDPSQVRRDETRGFLHSGIIELDLPAVEPPPGESLTWLRAVVTGDRRSVSEAVAVRAGAVEALFEDRGNDPGHFASSLAPGSIEGLVESAPEIASLEQPFASFGGRAAEDEMSFRTRVSERLRHRDRALTTWDLEHIVLEQFHTLFKVKAFPASAERPGHVDVVVVPDTRGQIPFESIEPRASAALLAEIRDFLDLRRPSGMSLSVENPTYVQVKARLAVRFRDQSRLELDRLRLQEDLIRHLAPWAFDQGHDVEIGNRIYANSLMDFVERRPYVDYAADPRLFVSEDGEHFVSVEESASGGLFAQAGAKQILVPAREQEIDFITGETFEPGDDRGIGFMEIELDFVVAGDASPTPDNF